VPRGTKSDGGRCTNSSQIPRRRGIYLSENTRMSSLLEIVRTFEQFENGTTSYHLDMAKVFKELGTTGFRNVGIKVVDELGDKSWTSTIKTGLDAIFQITWTL
jgi:uncharacterized protein with von Willebrand factor type A (vWA) domain